MKPLHACGRDMRGLSLVELMVAITIGLIIMAAVSSLFVSSKQTYTTQDSLARLQENARFAMQFLIKDLRLAGYFGCLDTVDTSTTNITLNGGTNFNNDAFFPVEGVENASGTWSRSTAATLPTGMKAGTDAFVVRMADESASANIAPGMLNGFSTLNVDNVTPFKPNDNVIVADCEGADVMKITGIAGTALQHGAGSLRKAYAPPARIIKMVTRQYFISTKTVDGKPVPVLMRDENGTANELVEGIENLQVLYGEDTDGPPDGVANIYRTADAVADWTKVTSIRIGILARTIDDKNTDVDNVTYDVDGDGTDELANPGDRYRRRIFQATVQMRNIKSQ